MNAVCESYVEDNFEQVLIPFMREIVRPRRLMETNLKEER